MSVMAFQADAVRPARTRRAGLYDQQALPKNNAVHKINIAMDVPLNCL